MRLTTLLAFSCLLACKPQPQATVSTAPAVATVEEDEWNGFGGNEHPEDEEPGDGEPATEVDADLKRVEQLCKKVAAVAAADADVDPDLSELLQDTRACSDATYEELMIRPEGFDAFAACLLSTNTVADVLKCNELTGSRAAEQQPTDPADMLVQVCEKMTELVLKDPDIPEEAKREVPDIDTCVTEARKEYEKDPEKFERTANCVLDARSMVDVVHCAMENDER